MKLWLVWNRRPLAPRERLIYIARYATCATSAEAAIDTLKREYGEYGGTWEAKEVADYIALPFTTDKPTTEERKHL